MRKRFCKKKIIYYIWPYIPNTVEGGKRRKEGGKREKEEKVKLLNTSSLGLIFSPRLPPQVKLSTRACGRGKEERERKTTTTFIGILSGVFTFFLPFSYRETIVVEMRRDAGNLEVERKLLRKVNFCVWTGGEGGRLRGGVTRIKYQRLGGRGFSEKVRKGDFILLHSSSSLDSLDLAMELWLPYCHFTRERISVL